MSGTGKHPSIVRGGPDQVWSSGPCWTNRTYKLEVQISKFSRSSSLPLLSLPDP